jgi:two-component system sensor kinase FixL
VKRPIELNDPVLAAIEREQQRIGNQLHEKLCQTLAGISIQAGLLTHRAGRGEAVEVPEIQQLTENIQRAIDETRALSRELRGGTLDEGGLIEALARLANLTDRQVKCEFVCEKPVFVRDTDIALALLRIAEESVRNAIQHGAPTKILISLDRDGSAVTVKIQDDGTGFTPPGNEEALSGIGLMHRRARAAGARLNIVSEPGRGAAVTCRITS